MTDVLTWTIERRVQLTDQAELLRKEQAGLEAEAARLEVAEVLFGQSAEATDGGRRATRSRSRRHCGWAGCAWDASGARPC